MPPKIIKVKPKKAQKQSGSVYRIDCLCGCEGFYIGSTSESLSKRMAGHRRDMKLYQRPLYNHMREVDDPDQFTISLVERVEFNTREELAARENYYIRTLGAIKNGFNRRIEVSSADADIRKTLTERTKKWSADNKDRYKCMKPGCTYATPRRLGLLSHLARKHNDRTTVVEPPPIRNRVYNCMASIAPVASNNEQESNEQETSIPKPNKELNTDEENRIHFMLSRFAKTGIISAVDRRFLQSIYT
jgi:hypothetical protein